MHFFSDKKEDTVSDVKRDSLCDNRSIDLQNRDPAIPLELRGLQPAGEPIPQLQPQVSLAVLGDLLEGSPFHESTCLKVGHFLFPREPETLLRSKLKLLCKISTGAQRTSALLRVPHQSSMSSHPDNVAHCSQITSLKPRLNPHVRFLEGLLG